jgi:hypothetical protein
MSESFTSENKDGWNPMSNDLLRQLEGFEENGNRNGNGKERKKRNLLSIHYLRRIIVCDGIVKVEFCLSESDLTDSRIWIPDNFETFESFLFDNCKLVSSIAFECIGCKKSPDPPGLFHWILNHFLK